MKTVSYICAAILLASGPAAVAQQTTATPTVPADATAAAAAPTLTEAEQATMKKCAKMAPAQQAQSSKCSAVMTKAGKDDPAKSRGPGPSR
ncbi:hypothetical protein NF700_07080 [Sphingomonadaceae bacterium OTU29MARTA1]|nr:hypothetical protein NF699_08295 [Sphingomonadaceae bacterium OTU29LAMAA1]USU10013.1 hypothetical protein NF700_07080 [Sphingomonadaceae bacterium OTU29MARTA1]